jgi:hypothetical protein
LALLAKLCEIEVGFARNPGTVPRRPKESFHLKLSFWQSWVKVALQKQVVLQPKAQYNNANQAELESTVFIGIAWACEGYKAAKFRR